MLYKWIKKNKKGFTLIELMLVIAIIGILVAAAVLSYGNSTEKAKEATAFSDMETIATAVNVYYGETGTPLTGELSAKVCPTLTTAGYLQTCPTVPHKDGIYDVRFNKDSNNNMTVDIVYTSNKAKVRLDYLSHTVTALK